MSEATNKSRHNKEVSHHYDVVIVGAGPTGVVTANFLGEQGIRTLVIDKESDVIDIPRAVGICEEGSRIVDATGLGEEISKGLVEINDVFFMDKKINPMFRLGFNEALNGNPALRTFHQPKAERVFRKGLKRYPNVEVWQNTECLQFSDLGDQVKLRVLKRNKSNNEQYLDISCRYMLAADGARSSIRKMLNIPFEGRTYAQDWLVVDIKKDPSKDSDRSYIYFICDPDRPGVSLPTPDGGRRWEFVVKAGETEEQMTSDENLRKLLKPWCNLEDIELERRSVYTFHAVIAKKFSIGNVFLLGDAAHLTPPFAGQGLMAGLRDAYNLAWKLAFVLKGKLPESFLNTYSEERRPQASLIVSLARLVGIFILPQNPLLAKARDWLFKLGTRSLGNQDDEQRSGLRKVPNNIVGYKALRYWQKDPNTLETGFELPQFNVQNSQQTTRPIDRYLPCEFIVLSYNNNAVSCLQSNTYEKFRFLGGQFIELGNQPICNNENPNSNYLFDIDNEYSTLFEHGSKHVLIRPDRMVVAIASHEDLDKTLNEYFCKIGIPSIELMENNTGLTKALSFPIPLKRKLPKIA
ncbi:MAG: FAD-dependent monooxygenase [Pseudomonadales bacterium]|nr:FAD-dependent monooxygenase [Pseudomonadales bacterium]